MTTMATSNPSALASTAATSNNSASSSSSSSSTSGANSLVNESTFLQLLVAQLQNQDPLNPDQQSGTQMVSELAQFSELEQVMGINQNVQTITTDIGTQAAAAGQSSSTGSSTSTDGTAATGTPATSDPASTASTAAQLS
ncbi:MAG: flagellar hook capping FlgD N-terminal domain-containing protein [Bryobacteraceae bacterium]